MSQPPDSVLPVNRSLLEAGLDQAFAQFLERIAPPFPDLMNAATTPAEFLPYLAADRGVAEWKADATESEKRATVASAWEVKRLAGTRRALEQAVASLELRPKIIAWHQGGSGGNPYEIEVIAWVDRVYDEQMDARLNVRLAAAKSERDTLKTVIGLITSSPVHVAAGLQCGELTTIYPLRRE